MADDKEEPTVEQKKATLLLDLMKENTAAMLDLQKAIGALLIAITGAPPSERHEDGVEGLLEKITTLDESVAQLDTRMIGLSINISKWTFVGEKLTAIRSGDPSAEPPVEGRDVTFNDWSDALLEYEQKVEEEAALAEKEEEEERKREEEEDAAEEAAEQAAQQPQEPAKPPMLGNSPAKKLPPLPVAAPKPGE